jgi:acyl dehydratase
MSEHSEDRTLFPKITDQGLEALQSRVGVKIENTLEPWCHEATRDNIRHYAHGIGDDNPLWCDPDYAAGTAHGGIVAPPSFLFACSRIISGYVGGLPGVHAMWAGADWTWHRMARRNDEIATEAWLKELIPHETRFSGRAIQQVYHVNFFNQDGDLLAEADSWCFRTDRDIAREEGTKYDDIKHRPAKVGATPRYFEDVSVGDKLPTMVKGPMTVTGFIAYAHRQQVQHSRLPGAGSLGGRFRPYGRRPRGLRLRARALLLDDPPPNQLGRRRRVPAPLGYSDPAAQSGRRYAVHQRRGDRQARGRRARLYRDQAGRAEPGRRAVDPRHRGGALAAARVSLRPSPPSGVINR